MTTDPLSDILALVKAQNIMSGGFRAGGVWAIRFPEPHAIQFGAVVQGSCWLSMEGQESPVHLDTGDVILANGQHALVLASEPTAEPVDAVTVFANAVDGIATCGNGEEFLNLGGHVALDEACGDLLLDALPPLIHVRASAPEAAAIQWLLGQLVAEMTTKRPGTTLASSQLSQLMFVQLLRAYLAATDSAAPGWLRALADRRITVALRLMHSDPAKPWQLEDLAKAAGMSRTNFALRFKSIVGVAPLTYLTRWRMRLAARVLGEGGSTVSTLALSLGYTSESAFSNAFKRTMGMAPKRYQAARHSAGNNRQGSLASRR